MVAVGSDNVSVKADADETHAELTLEGKLSETPVGDIEELESRIKRLRNTKQKSQSELNELQSVIRFNQDRFEEILRSL